MSFHTTTQPTTSNNRLRMIFLTTAQWGHLQIDAATNAMRSVWITWQVVIACLVISYNIAINKAYSFDETIHLLDEMDAKGIAIRADDFANAIRKSTSDEEINEILYPWNVWLGAGVLGRAIKQP